METEGHARSALGATEGLSGDVCRMANRSIEATALEADSQAASTHSLDE